MAKKVKPKIDTKMVDFTKQGYRTFKDKKPKLSKEAQGFVKTLSSKPKKKSIAKKVAKKALGRAVPGLGAALIAGDVIKGVSKATCSKRGGKWTGGKCVGAKKTKLKPNAPVRDPISKR